MKAVFCVCVAAMVLFSANGQSDADLLLCDFVPDFRPCIKEDFNCNLQVSQCYCKSQIPFCRCKNYNDEFYLGKDCSQKWTVLTFALVASLPGAGLALVISIIVGIASCTCCRSSKNPPTRQENKVATIPEEDPFPGVVFASDLNSRPNVAPPGPRQPQVGVPMTTTSSRPYSGSNNTPDRPPMGGSKLPYSVSSNTPDRPQMGGSQLPYSVSNSTSERPQMGGSQLPYSYSAGPGQVLRNPYAKSRNPYEERSASPEPYYQPQSSPRPYEDQRAAPSSGPTYSAFPRAQISRGY